MILTTLLWLAGCLILALLSTAPASQFWFLTAGAGAMLMLLETIHPTH